MVSQLVCNDEQAKEKEKEKIQDQVQVRSNIAIIFCMPLRHQSMPASSTQRVYPGSSGIEKPNLLTPSVCKSHPYSVKAPCPCPRGIKFLSQTALKAKSNTHCGEHACPLVAQLLRSLHTRSCMAAAAFAAYALLHGLTKAQPSKISPHFP